MPALGDAGYSRRGEPIRTDEAVKPTTKSEDKHMKIHKYLGLDVHQDDTVIAVAEGDRTGEVRVYGKVSYTRARRPCHSLQRGHSLTLAATRTTEGRRGRRIRVATGAGALTVRQKTNGLKLGFARRRLNCDSFCLPGLRPLSP